MRFWGPGAVERYLTKLLAEEFWVPDGTSDAAARDLIGEPRQSTRLSRISVDHYLYFPTREQAERAADRLTRMGYTVRCEERGNDQEGVGEQSWLVLASHFLVPDDSLALDRISDELERLADAEGGEYDGYERDVPS